MGKLAFCTIIAQNYLPQAKVLATSIRKFYPEAPIYVGFADRETNSLCSSNQLFEWIKLSQLGIPQLDSFCFKYSTVELATAMKPFLMQSILDKSGIDTLIYLDPDILLLRQLTPVESSLNTHSVALTPHILSPILDSFTPTELDILRAGTFNLGFIGVANTKESRRLLSWWKDRLYDGCQMDLDRGLHVDQRWMDLIPSFFPESIILREPGLNIAYWNLRDRHLTRRGDDWFVNSMPAYFFHFSGFNPREPETISRHFFPQKIVESPALAELQELYAEQLEANGYENSSGLTPGYDTFNSGETIPTKLRQEYLLMKPSQREQFGNPYDNVQTGSLYRWWHEIERSKSTFGASETSSYPFGINLFGFFDEQTSLTNVASQLGMAFIRSNIPQAIHTLHGTFDKPILSSVRRESLPIYNTNLFVANADWMELKVLDHSDLMGGRYNVALWNWESPIFPERWKSLCGLFDEIWVSSHFIRTALMPWAGIPIAVIPPPVTEMQATHSVQRDDLPVMHKAFIFSFIFDWRSFGYRKNPMGLIRAFQKAFPQKDDERVSLLIKTRNGHLYPEELRQLVEIGSNDPRICVWDVELNPSQIRSVLKNTDCFVSLHRAEGFGMSIAEAMLEGKPVITTGYSGNMDFTTRQNSRLVNFAIKELGHKLGPYPSNSLWAEPDLGDAADHMRFVYTNREAAESLGESARASVIRMLSHEAVGHKALLRLAQLGLSPSKVPERIQPHYRRLRWLENSFELTKVNLSPQGKAKRAFGGVRKLAVRALWPILSQQSNFNALSIDEFTDLHREVIKLREQVKEMHRTMNFQLSRKSDDAIFN